MKQKYFGETLFIPISLIFRGMQHAKKIVHLTYMTEKAAKILAVLVRVNNCKIKQYSISEALENLKETIIELGAQGPSFHWGDAYLGYLLHDAVARLDWAQAAITRCTASGVTWNIHKVYTALKSSWM